MEGVLQLDPYWGFPNHPFRGLVVTKASQFGLQLVDGEIGRVLLPFGTAEQAHGILGWIFSTGGYLMGAWALKKIGLKKGMQKGGRWYKSHLVIICDWK